MEPEEIDRKSERRKQLQKDIHEYRPIKSLFLVDILQDRDSRPMLMWAGTTLLIGVLTYHWLEGWSFVDALYFCVITLATIGYGDLTPTTTIAKLFTIFYVVNGIVILLALFDRIRVVRMNRLSSNASSQDTP